MASHFFGPLGSMERLVVSAGITTETARASSEFVSSGGVRYVQRGRTAPRSWTVGRQYQGPDWARLLGLAAHGLLEQCWLYDVAAARENMIPARLSAGGGVRRRRNLLPNPGFDGLPGAGWSARANITYTRDDEWMRAAYGSANTNQIPLNSLAFPTESGKVYTCSVSIRNAGNKPESVYIRHYPGASNGSEASSAPITLNPGGSARLTVTSKMVPDMESSAQIFLYCTTFTAGQTVLALKDPVAEEGAEDGGPLNGSLPGAAWEGDANKSPSYIVINERIKVGGLPLEALAVGHQVQVPVLAGRLYSIAAWASVDTQLFTYQVGDGAVGSAVAIAGVASASFTPRTDTILTVTVSRTGVSGLTVRDGSFNGQYMAGYGTPCKVAVQDPQRTLHLVTNQVRSDYQVTLLEVGQPGAL